MSCYLQQVIWKGQDGILQIPFEYSGSSGVSVAIKTYGIPQVVYNEDEFTIEDGYINIPFQDTDFDILPDGVFRYIIDFQVEGYDGVISNNLNAVLRTPDNYSAQTADDIWQDGYDSGYTDGVQDSGSTEAYDNGFNDGHASGVTDGMNQQKSLLTNAQFNTNGMYRRENGWNLVYVNVEQTGYTQQDITTAYNSGITEGKNEQKQLLSNTAFTINGSYTNDNGWSAITVNVEGGSANLTTLTATTNNTTYTPSTGYDGFSSVHVEVPDTFDSGWTAGYDSGFTDGFASGQTDGYNVGYLDGEQEGYNNGYDSGYTDGFNSGYTGGKNEGYNSGITYQKSLLSGITITENGTYTNENGYSSVTVNVESSSIGSVFMYRSTTGQKIDNLFTRRMDTTYGWANENSGASIVSHDYYTDIDWGIVVFDKPIVKLAEHAFEDFPTLKYIILPDTVWRFSERSFKACTALTGGIFAKNAEYNDYPGYMTFEECESLNNPVLPVNMKAVAVRMFNECTGLTTISIPSGVTSIGSSAFALCNLTGVTIPSGVTQIGLNAFVHNEHITHITILATTPPTLGQAAFDYTNNCPIYVPAASVSAYQSAGGYWSDYSSRIQAITQ